jgi:hypothetical protein
MSIYKQEVAHGDTGCLVALYDCPALSTVWADPGCLAGASVPLLSSEVLDRRKAGRIELWNWREEEAKGSPLPPWLRGKRIVWGLGSQEKRAEKGLVSPPKRQVSKQGPSLYNGRDVSNQRRSRPMSSSICWV